jgi:hypothetical protein
MDGYLLYVGCQKIPVTGSLKVTGTWTANAKGTYSDNTTTTGSMTFPLSPACLTVSSAPVACSDMTSVFTSAGWATAKCETDTSGQCSCSVTANQRGGIGVIFGNASDKGDYTTTGGVLNTDGEMDYSYCVSGDTLTLTPKSKVLPLSGTIVLKSASPGTGGAAPGSGGITGAGGAIPGSGGRTGAGGGTTGLGGTTGAGGATPGSGGTTGGAGGTTIGNGGAKGSGGAGGGAGATTGAGGTSGTGGTTSVGGASGKGPCDIYAAASAKCVAAHSTVRALFAGYTDKLYQVKRASDSKRQDIGATADGFADSAAQDAFCTGTTCVITFVYDQSGNGNNVEAETADSTVKGNAGQSASNATQEPLKVGGHNVYSLYLKQAQAYWKDGSKTGMPIGKDPQGIYMVTSGKHFGSGCCFDYGNGETSRTYVAGPSMDALNFSNCTIWGTGNGSGPWVMADLEGGLYSQGGGGKNDKDLSLTYTYVTAIEKNNGTGTFALKGADATTGNLSTFYSGNVPPGYNPSTKQGSIVLGSGGDCCYSNTTMSQGTFYEGAIVSGYPTDATDDAIQANVVNAGYGK